MTGSERPWWSSGSGPDARVEPGPAAEDRAGRERQRAARERADPRGEPAPGDRTGRTGARDEQDHGHQQGYTSGDTADNGHGASHTHAHAHDHHAHAQDHGAHDHAAGLGPGEVCQVCPICTALRLVGEVRPDLLVHLAEAARHLTLAAKTIVDAQARGFGGGGLQHIPLDDDPS